MAGRPPAYPKFKFFSALRVSFPHFGDYELEEVTLILSRAMERELPTTVQAAGREPLSLCGASGTLTTQEEEPVWSLMKMMLFRKVNGTHGISLNLLKGSFTLSIRSVTEVSLDWPVPRDGDWSDGFVERAAKCPFLFVHPVLSPSLLCRCLSTQLPSRSLSPQPAVQPSLHDSSRVVQRRKWLKGWGQGQAPQDIPQWGITI